MIQNVKKWISCQFINIDKTIKRTGGAKIVKNLLLMHNGNSQTITKLKNENK